MTKERAKELLPIITAFAEGKEIEGQYGDEKYWISAQQPLWNENVKYRIKPTPTYRPWKPEEVPVGAILRSKVTGVNAKWLIVYCALEGISVGSGNTVFMHETIFERYEHSTDNGKTWHPCGIQE